MGLNAHHTIGRSPRCVQVLDQPFISAQHAQLRWTGGAWELRDLGSRNGTFVNGQRTVTTERVRLRAGDRIRFGQEASAREELWLLVDDEPPAVMAVPVGGGAPARLTGGLLLVPSADHPQAMIFSRDGQWLLETDGNATHLVDGDTFTLEGERWRFCAPMTVATTVTQVSPASIPLESIKLAFRVSADEEHVELLVDVGNGPISLGIRAHHYLALTLARQRLEDARTGACEHGWMYVDDLVRRFPGYATASRLNVDIYRLRRQAAELGVTDPARIVERRPGEVRLGVASLEILRIEEPPPASGSAGRGL